MSIFFFHLETTKITRLIELSLRLNYSEEFYW